MIRLHRGEWNYRSLQNLLSIISLFFPFFFGCFKVLIIARSRHRLNSLLYDSSFGITLHIFPLFFSSLIWRSWIQTTTTVSGVKSIQNCSILFSRSLFFLRTFSAVCICLDSFSELVSPVLWLNFSSLVTSNRPTARPTTLQDLLGHNFVHSSIFKLIEGNCHSAFLPPETYLTFLSWQTQVRYFVTGVNSHPLNSLNQLLRTFLFGWSNYWVAFSSVSGFRRRL